MFIYKLLLTDVYDSVENYKPMSKALSEFIVRFLTFFLPMDVSQDKDNEMNEQNGPYLFVMNHTTPGYDIPLFVLGMRIKNNLVIRGLSDNLHFVVPFHKQIVQLGGGIRASHENADKAFQGGQSVLVYPGGGREILKKKTDEKYKLFWKQRKGFARLAIRNKVTIIPVSCLGSEDTLNIIGDVDFTFIARAFGDMRAEFSWPIVAPLILPQKVYFHFGKPVSTNAKDGESEEETLNRVREETYTRVSSGIQLLKNKQRNDPHRFNRFFRMYFIQKIYTFLGFTNTLVDIFERQQNVNNNKKFL